MSMISRIWKTAGPIVLSALSLLISACIVQWIVSSLDPRFDILASRGTGKVILTTMIIMQLLLFFSIRPQRELQNFYQRCCSWIPAVKIWGTQFLQIFMLFFVLHWLTLGLFVTSGYATTQSCWHLLKPYVILDIGWGFLVTFLLAWSEETMFRGMIFPFLAARHHTLISIFITSLAFSLAHSITNPLKFFTAEWQLGLGLFLLGVLLNVIYVAAGELYNNMAVHAGVVYVKVILRRLPLIIFSSSTGFAWWVNSDLRQSHLVHLLFASFALAIILFNWERFTAPRQFTLLGDPIIR